MNGTDNFNPHQIIWKDQRLVLHPERCLWWPARRILMVADLHLGKARSFHKHGIPVPESSMDDIARLRNILQIFNPRELVFLGDLVHDRDSLEEPTARALTQLRDEFRTTMILTPGNHDLDLNSLARLVPCLQVEKSVWMNPFRLLHNSEDCSGSEASICGHVHPGVRVRTGSHSSTRFPCFALDHDKNTLTLPAFGGFTGLHLLEPTPTLETYPVVERTVFTHNHGSSKNLRKNR
jgi:DNA ligase-associated metallophosphoesterase